MLDSGDEGTAIRDNVGNYISSTWGYIPEYFNVHRKLISPIMLSGFSALSVAQSEQWTALQIPVKVSNTQFHKTDV